MRERNIVFQLALLHVNSILVFLSVRTALHTPTLILSLFFSITVGHVAEVVWHKLIDNQRTKGIDSYSPL